MKFHFNLKADVGSGFFHFGLTGRNWRIGGWFWPMGFFAKFGPIDFIWYTKKLLKTRQQEIWIKDKWHWYGAITFNGWR